MLSSITTLLQRVVNGVPSPDDMASSTLSKQNSKRMSRLRPKVLPNLAARHAAQPLCHSAIDRKLSLAL